MAPISSHAHLDVQLWTSIYGQGGPQQRLDLWDHQGSRKPWPSPARPINPKDAIHFGLYDRQMSKVVVVIEANDTSTHPHDPRSQGLSTTTDGVTSTLRYSTANAAFYYGYIVSVLPLALILQRLPIVKTLAGFIFIWGVVCLLTVVVKDYKGLVVQRVFLGLTEVSRERGGRW